MNELPESVRKQLAKEPMPGVHPDADILAGFGEDALTPKERQQVMEHLAACAECREIVFLAQPEATSQTVLVPLKSRRFAWMAWASAAVVIVVGSAVLIQREEVQKIQPPAVANMSKPPEAEVSKFPESEQIVGGATKAGSEIPTRSVAAPPQSKPTEKDRRQELAKFAPAPVVAGKLEREVSADFKKQSEEKAAPPPILTAQNDATQSVPARNSANVLQNVQQNAVQGVVAGGPANTANANMTNVYQANQAAPVPARAAKSARSKSEAVPTAAAPTQAFGYALDRQAGAIISARPHWRISDSGTLERSFGNDAWSPVLAESHAAFRIVSVVGDSVWAGGDKGALFVSRDDGMSWNPVKLGTKEAIISIRFSDGLHGTVQGDSGAVWKTSDGGVTWAK
ncbi:MAG TPA: zf-HC2 domain-containing protein [Terriglobales bacterium]